MELGGAADASRIVREKPASLMTSPTQTFVRGQSIPAYSLTGRRAFRTLGLHAPSLGCRARDEQRRRAGGGALRGFLRKLRAGRRYVKETECKNLIRTFSTNRRFRRLKISQSAHVRSMEEYEEMRAHAERDPEGFWGEQAKMLDWFEPPKKILEWDMPHAKWFVGGKLNVSDNCLDRHLEENGNKPALLWEAEDGATLQLTYAELHERVCQFANVLLSTGREGRRLRGDLHADDSGIAGCDAGLRANWGGAFRDFWRV